jgi:hypothetical protein
MVHHLTRWHPVTEPSLGRRDVALCHAAWTLVPPAPSLGRVIAQCDFSKNGRRNPRLRKYTLYTEALLHLTSSRIQCFIIQFGPADHFDCKQTVMAVLVQKVLLTFPKADHIGNVATNICNRWSIFYQSRLLVDTGQFLCDNLVNF